MQKLLSLPPNLIHCFHELEEVNHTDWFCTSDPIGSKLGSGGGTTWLLQACHQAFAPQESFSNWIGHEKKILLHAGGQSRRLPSYGPSGKILTPIPIFSWERGQKLGQNLLSLQLPLYERIMNQAPAGLNTLIASGDVYIRSEKPLQDIPNADVVCYGLWVNPSLATHHGVFVSDRKKPEVLDFMLQKPSLEELEGLSKTHLFLMDIGIWILSDRAIEVLMKRSLKEGTKDITYYDLYSDYGLALGEHPKTKDEEINQLSVAILPLPGGEFYHYGTSHELISSTLAIQDKVRDQRRIMHRKVKPNPAIFIQNSITQVSLSADNANLWIENSQVGKEWKLGSRQIITGVPENQWSINLPDGVCIDIIPIGENEFVARPYGLDDVFKGALDKITTTYLNVPFTRWMEDRGITWEDIKGRTDDLQSASIFPKVASVEDLGILVRWMTSEPQLEEGKKLWLKAEKVSADEISANANLKRLYEQRNAFRKENWKGLAANYEKSVFYQLDLLDAVSVRKFFDEEQPEYVFLAAAFVGGIMANSIYRADFIYKNLQIQQNIIGESFRHNVRKLLFLGSTCIYPRDAEQPMKEDVLLTSPLEYTNEPYAIAKIAGLKMCESFNLQYGTNYIAVMPTNLYGPNDNFDLERSHVLPAMIRKIHLAHCLKEGNWEAVRKDMNLRPVEGVNGDSPKEEILAILQKYGISETEVTLWGTGTPLREFLWSEEMADASVFVMEHVDFKDTYKEGSKDIRNCHINIGTGKEITIRQLAERIVETVGYQGKLTFDSSKPDGTMRKLTDPSKLHSLGWHHKIEIEEGVQRMYEWYLK